MSNESHQFPAEARLQAIVDADLIAKPFMPAPGQPGNSKAHGSPSAASAPEYRVDLIFREPERPTA